MAEYAALEARVSELERQNRHVLPQKIDAVAYAVGLVHEDVRQIRTVQGEHTRTLDLHTRTLGQHGQMLEQHGQILTEHTRTLASHSQMLEQIGRTLEQHGRVLEEILRRLPPA